MRLRFDHDPRLERGLQLRAAARQDSGQLDEPLHRNLGLP
jgi:hypothetical protein